ncbi:aspartate kinase [Tenacibaculum maritimum]|uniref:Aspartokinase n=1 Tax=Tenacibaculum maritimum NCIMB 2154 TaxID=1349785 RepID=A0A2H1EDP6_9FLAO|nr:aspartate kinase [Tenacibaculum maritimum]MCD9562368.1 aspartate kinase [Tenacibaculum maritimum]MCD9565731.1 aspartate kinase [Tenacibaculum maritimum]MCD9579350.1 aspartate kinase [Tenacibaculum maritimum]MCD9596266.1 aspartate kinase [Tenacibaculum maritimum]MCD9613604.1 aspartate kinase [Tenacibaculum maritimum]
MIVLKFGGTSVGTSKSIKEVVRIITEYHPSQPKIVVLSAVSGTTNSLLEISQLILQNKKEEALLKIHNLQKQYDSLIKGLFSVEKYISKAQLCSQSIFTTLQNIATNYNDAEKMIVAQGEILSTHLIHIYLEEQQINATLISALNFMSINANNEPEISTISKNIKPILAQSPNQNIFLTQGYICKDTNGAIANLQRGGSDYTASLIGAAIEAEEIQIWTDINGMHNNDPRYVENTFSIDEISFDEAAELAYFGAKILHPQSLIPAKEKNIPVLLKNTFNPLQKGTIIKNKAATNGITAIAAKDGIVAIKIKSYRMLLAYGFLKKVFEIFEKYKTPIDMITTSEVAVSLTIDDTSYLTEIRAALETYGKVEIDSSLSIICVAGNFSQNTEGLSAKVFDCLKNIPVRMISYGGSNYNTSLLVKTTDKMEALNALNEGLFTENLTV